MSTFTQTAVAQPDDQQGSRLFATDFQSLSLFRIAFSIYLLADFFLFNAPYFAEFYTDAGFVPLASLEGANGTPGRPFVYPVLTVFEALRLPAVLPFLYPLALVGMALGYKTRWCNAIALVFFSYMFWRNPYIRSGAESLAHLLLLWCLFLPMSRYWSVDAALDIGDRRRPWPVLPFLAIKLQVCSVYFFAALFKLQGAPWRDGQAVSWALSDNAFGGMPTGLFLVEHAPLFLAFATYAVIALQLSFPLLVFSPWRNDITRAVALAGVASMHVSFMFALNIGGFPFLCLTMLLILIPDAWIDGVFQRRRKRLQNAAIYFEPDCGFCEKVARLFREFLLPPAAPVLPASTDAEAMRLLSAHNSWVVRGADGNVRLKWRAVAYLLSESLVLGPLGWLTDARPVRGAFERLYDSIGRNRRTLGRLTRHLLKFRSEPAPGPAVIAICGGLMLLAFIGNVHHATRPASGAPTRLDHLVATFQVGQRWSLFAPVPVHSHHTYRASARTGDGSTFDVLAASTRPFLRTRGEYRVEFPNHRWLKYFNRASSLSERDRITLGDYLCRLARAGSGEPHTDVRQVDFTTSRTPVPGAPVGEVRTNSKTYTFDCRQTGADLQKATAIASPAGQPAR